MTLYLGADPGASGAIAAVDEAGELVALVRGSETYRDLVECVRACTHGRTFAILEQVGPARGRDGRRQGVSSAFKFGQHYGALEMLFTACEVPFERVTPAKWQAAMKCRTGGDKNVSKRRAQELFPGVKVAHWNADALLLAEHCRRLRTGLLESA